MLESFYRALPLGRPQPSSGHRITLILGEAQDDTLPGLYRSAAACGVPVIAGRSGGLPDAVQDGVTGILVDPLDLGSVAESLVSVLTDKSLARRLGAAGRQAVLERFTWEHMAREARRLFEEATRCVSWT